MVAFLADQLDFILFFYGLAFILLGAVCVAVARGGQRTLPWSVLGAFAYVHGAGEWLDLFALIMGDAPAFALARTALMTGSFVIFVEFGRLGASQAGYRMPGRWIYLPLLALTVYGWYLAGTSGANAFARYSLCLPGAALTAAAFAIQARGSPPAQKHWLIIGAIAVALYGFAAGAIVPVTPGWQGDFINYEIFTNFIGLPIQLVRGLLACFTAFAIWAYWGQVLIADVATLRYTKFQRRQFVRTLVAMIVILIAGWFLTNVLGDIYRRNVQIEARGDLDLIGSRLQGDTVATEGMAKVLAGSREIVALADKDPKSNPERFQAILELETEAVHAGEGYILDRSGAIIAATATNAAEPGSNFFDTKYFREAIAGRAGHAFTVEPFTNVPYYFASYPVRSANGGIIAVAVLKKSLSEFESDIGQFDRSFAVIDRYGIVLITNRPEMRFQTLWPLSQDLQKAQEREYGPLIAKPLLAREIVGSMWGNFDGERNYIRRQNIPNGDWSLVTWKVPQSIFASRVLGIIITLQMTIMVLVYLVGREHWVHDNIQMEKRLELEELARNLDNRAATDPLTGLFNRRRFDRALAAEILRAERYNTPVSLVLFDVDHFKKINDVHGHQAGDRVLIEMSRLAAAHIRDSDTLARWGAEEFVILCPGSSGPMACQLAGNLHDRFGALNLAEVGMVTCSFGVAEFAAGDSAETLLARADSALYRAKKNGRNRVELAPQPPSIVSPALAPFA